MCPRSQKLPPEHSTVHPAGSHLSGASTDSNGDTLATIFHPWPGAHFLAPILLVLVAQPALAAIGLRTVAAREQVSTSRDDGLDIVLRRRSSEGIVSFLLVALALPLPLFGSSMVEAATWRVAEWDYLRGTVGGLGILVVVGCMLAGDLRVAPGTVARAYKEMEAAGLLVSRRGAGTRVAPESQRSPRT